MRETEFWGFSVGDGTDTVRLTGPDGAVETYRGRWMTGSLVLWADGDASLLRSDPDDDSDHLSQYFVLPETVCEWTGYCDKNGRRIYEGDRVRVPDSMRSRGSVIVQIGLHHGVWCVLFAGGDWDFLSANAMDAEVIGTVYDPEVTGDDRALAHDPGDHRPSRRRAADHDGRRGPDCVRSPPEKAQATAERRDGAVLDENGGGTEMTIGGWICFAFFAALLIFGAFLAFISSEKIAVRIAVSFLCGLAVIGLLIGMLWYFGNTASGQRAMVDQQSDLGNGLDRIVRVYTANGDIIAEFEGTIDIEGNDGGYVLFDYQGKRYTYYNCFVESIAEIGE